MKVREALMWLRDIVTGHSRDEPLRHVHAELAALKNAEALQSQAKARLRERMRSDSIWAFENRLGNPFRDREER